jgi:hypothetical protein
VKYILYLCEINIFALYSYGNICCSLSYFGFSVTDAYALWLASSQNETKYLAFQALVFELTYLMNVIPETT